MSFNIGMYLIKHVNSNQLEKNLKYFKRISDNYLQKLQKITKYIADVYKACCKGWTISSVK